MVHGGSRSTRSGGHRWPVIILGVALSLILTDSGGRTQNISLPPSPATNHRQQISGVYPVPRPREELHVPAVSVTTAPIALLPNELLYDAWPAFVKPSPLSAESQSPVAKPSAMWMYVTAYCACKKCCGSHAVGMTASGRPISYNGGHFIAADTTILPYGSKVIVPGYNDGNPVEVIDRGGAIKGAHIDVFMPTHEEAVEWGKKRLEITIVR